MNNENLILENNLILISHIDGIKLYRPSGLLYVLYFYNTIYNVEYLEFYDLLSKTSVNVNITCKIIYSYNDSNPFDKDLGSLIYIPDKMLFSNDKNLLIRKVEDFNLMQ